MSATDPLDLDELMRDLGTRTIGPGALTVLGGRIPADDQVLPRLLAHWEGIPLQFMLCDDTERIRLVRTDETSLRTLPLAARHIERLRLFGAVAEQVQGPLPDSGGDLELRRDGAGFHWRFVGPPLPDLHQRLKASGFESRDFWDQHPNTRLRQRPRTVLLWGERRERGGRFAEPRAGWADLDYPVEMDPGRARLTYWEFTSGGRVALVWWTGVSKHG